jgi:hypothetical protein
MTRDGTTESENPYRTRLFDTRGHRAFIAKVDSNPNVFACGVHDVRDDVGFFRKRAF